MKIKFLIFCISILTITTACKKNYRYSEINRAIENNNLSTLKDICERVNIDTLKFEYNRNILHQIVFNNCHNETLQLIAKKVNDSLFIKKDSIEFTPINLSIVNEREDLTQILLPKSKDLTSQDYYGLSPIHNAANVNSAETITYLVKKGIDVNSLDTSKRTPLHIAIEYKRLEAILKLKELKACDTIKDKDGLTALDYASKSNNIKITKLFINDLSNNQKNTVLEKLINSKETKIEDIEEYLSKKWVDKEKLANAFVFNKRVEIAEILLKQGINVNYKHSDFGVSALHRACIRGDLKMLKFLVENKAAINQLSKRKKTPLMYAATLKNPGSELHNSLAKFNGAIQLSIAGLGFFETSPEKTAANSQECVAYLLSKNANKKIKNKEGETAFNIAESTKNGEVAKLIYQYNK